ncbi:TPA: protein TolQ [Pseudomonas aeruginosa]|uniref:protein TolQ n=1 Tax=Pseudomonas TaxID=286 RepID=UPI0002F5C473|nr:MULTISPECIES: protein TolQ [Pseudomonas]MDF3866795.1 protein TolQ [Pseudomonas denitrificans (nom. rej.)]EKU7417897.1 protein TolQ [Pseudomonas aeruginosa]EKV4051777.1 protein TolQ [Pseudomonas aeruginosa]MBF2891786.1 protein TolQ [Pseudomonas aeruginosa]MBF2923808.1 protein TolQ [Pseudomonas aeruginosa]
MQATLEHTSIWALVEAASPLAQAVLLILLAASLVSWYVIVQRSLLLGGARRRLRAFEARWRASGDLQRLFRETTEPGEDAGVERIFHAGYQEFLHLRDEPGIDPALLIESSERAMRVVIAQEEERLQRGLPFLATVGSTSPYIGLFGTVWGIMNAFIGLSGVQQATLSTVAPGIAEALVATAVGLFAAIPAVMAYNRFAASSDQLLGRYCAFAEQLQAQLNRRIHAAPAMAAAA